MEIFQPIIAARVIFILGITNLVSGILILLTCRCLPTASIGRNLMKHKFYQRFYKYHCYIWWVFWISVIVHASFALTIMGVPW